MVEVSTA